MAEWAYNTYEHSSTRFTLFELVYERAPPHLFRYEMGTTTMQAMDEELRNKEHILALAQENLREVQTRMKIYANKKRTERAYEVGD